MPPWLCSQSTIAGRARRAVALADQVLGRVPAAVVRHVLLDEARDRLDVGVDAPEVLVLEVADGLADARADRVDQHDVDLVEQAVGVVDDLVRRRRRGRGVRDDDAARAERAHVEPDRRGARARRCSRTRSGGAPPGPRPSGRRPRSRCSPTARPWRSQRSSVPAVAVNATGTPPMTAVCCVTTARPSAAPSSRRPEPERASPRASPGRAPTPPRPSRRGARPQTIRFMTFPLEVRREAYRAEAGRDSIGAR